MKLYLFLCLTAVVSSFPQSGPNLCGSDERGVQRQVGDTWKEDCNTCRCTDNLVPGCTRRFCGVPSFPSKTTSAPRRAGAEAGEGAGETVAGEGAGAGGIQFPGASRGEPELAPETYCTDTAGNRREVGQSWKEDCNNCRCGSTGKSVCTLRFCVSRDVFLFTVDTSKSTDDIIQCKSEGAQNCKVVQLNHRLLSSSKVLKLFPGSDVELEVTRGPEDLNNPTLSYGFSVRGGGEGSLTYRQSTLATYGSIKPSGSIHYTVESCGEGCNVIYERNSDFFNNFED